MGSADPVAPIEVVPATADRWDDVVTILGGNGDLGCWCQAPRGRAAGYGMRLDFPSSDAGQPTNTRAT
jgi:hypothetical protein